MRLGRCVTIHCGGNRKLGTFSHTPGSNILGGSFSKFQTETRPISLTFHMPPRFTDKKFEKYRDVLFVQFRVIPDGFYIEYNKHIQKTGDSPESKSDFIWRCFNEVAMQVPGLYPPDDRRLYETLKSLYLEMGRFLLDTNRDRKHIQRKFFEAELKLIEIDSKNFGFEQEVEIIGTNCCEYCSGLDGLKMSVEETIQKNLLPGKCTRSSGCICCYAVVAKFDERGRLIPKQI